MSRASTRFLLVSIAALLTLGSTAPAMAHEEAKINGYGVEVGWVSEPVLVGFPNAVFLAILDPKEVPVRDLGDALKVEVGFGTERTPALTFEPTEVVGTYQAPIIPTRAGRFSFRLTGRLGGKPVDVTFSRSEEAEEPAELKFPVKDPSVGELAELVDRLAPRIDTGLREVRLAATKAKDAADQTRIVALVGLAIAVVALVLALARRRRAGA